MRNVRKFSTFTLAVLVCLQPTHAKDVASSETPLTSDEVVAMGNYAHCVVARHGGDARWFVLLMSDKSLAGQSTQRSVVQNTLSAMGLNCPRVDGKVMMEGLRYTRAILQFHTNAENLPQKADEFSDCFVEHMPVQANEFLINYDSEMESTIAAKSTGKTYTWDLDKLTKPMQKQYLQCFKSLDGFNSLDLNEMYSRVNWRLRALPAFKQVAVNRTAEPK